MDARQGGRTSCRRGARDAWVRSSITDASPPRMAGPRRHPVRGGPDGAVPGDGRTGRDAGRPGRQADSRSHGGLFPPGRLRHRGWCGRRLRSSCGRLLLVVRLGIRDRRRACAGRAARHRPTEIASGDRLRPAAADRLRRARGRRLPRHPARSAPADGDPGGVRSRGDVHGGKRGGDDDGPLSGWHAPKFKLERDVCRGTSPDPVIAQTVRGRSVCWAAPAGPMSSESPPRPSSREHRSPR